MDKEIKERKIRNGVNIKKKLDSFPSIVYRAGTEANLDGVYHFTEKKRKGLFETCNLKNRASSGEKKSGPQPMNNSLASLRHQRGRDNTDPRPANACTNSCANSALLNCIVRN